MNVELPAAAATRWPLRGRRAQLRRALAALESGRGDVLVGDPGLGKTRLAREILEEAGRRGHPVRRAAATPAARAIAFGALAHLLPAPGPGRGQHAEPPPARARQALRACCPAWTSGACPPTWRRRRPC